MPHNWIRTSPTTPNPGLRRRGDVAAVCARHHGQFLHLWFDNEDNPTAAYVLVKDGDVDGMMTDLQGEELIRLFEAKD
jgi:hypothetical protein